MSKLTELTRFDNQLEDLKRKSYNVLIESSISLKNLEALYENCDIMANSLLPLINPEKKFPFEHEQATIRRDKDSSQSHQDLYALVIRYQNFSNYLIRLIGASTSEEEEETIEETIRITKKLEGSLKEFLEVIKNSNSTLNLIENHFKPNDEATQKIINAQNQRMQEITNGINSGQRYNVLLDQIYKLLNDKENFKRELISEEIPKYVKSNTDQSSYLDENMVKVQESVEDIQTIGGTKNSLAGNLAKGKQSKVRSKKPGASGEGLDITEKAINALNDSYDTIVGLFYNVLGDKPNVEEKLKTLNSYKELVGNRILQIRTTPDTVDDVFELLKEYEKEKKEIISSSDVFKNLHSAYDKTDKLIENSAQIYQTEIPAEVEEVRNRKPAKDLNDLARRISFFINTLSRMTGMTEDSENVDEMLKKFNKSKTSSSLPFDPSELLHNLRNKKDKNLENLKFLSLLAGGDEVVDEVDKLIKEVNQAVSDKDPENNQEALELLEEWLSQNDKLEKSVDIKTKQLLDSLMERLTRSDPSEDEFEKLQFAIESLNLASEKLQKDGSEELDELQSRKEIIPADPSYIIRYLVDLVFDWSKFNLKMVAESTSSEFTKDEENTINNSIAKRMKAQPLSKLREIKAFYAGPDANDVVKLIILLNKAVDSIQPNDIDAQLLNYCKSRYENLERLPANSVRKLGHKYALLLIKLLGDKFNRPVEEIIEEIEESTTFTLTRRRDGKPISMISWKELIKSSGLDLDADMLAETIDREQGLAIPFIGTLVKYFGNDEDKIIEHRLRQRSEKVLQEDPKNKLEQYIPLRHEQSRLLNTIGKSIQATSDRLGEIDNERSKAVKSALSETSLTIRDTEAELKAHVDLLQSKEEEFAAQDSDNLRDLIIRFNGRVNIEKELQKIKDQCKPKDNTESEVIAKLRDIEDREYKALRNSFTTLFDLVNHLNPSIAHELGSVKSLTDLTGVNSTIPALVSSILIGLDSSDTIEQRKQDLLKQGPIKSKLDSLVRLIFESANLDSTETENVFTGLFRLTGSADDKNKARELKEAKSLQQADPETLWETVDLIDNNLNKAFPIRHSQSALQSKLVKSACGLRESADDIDLQTEDLLKKAVREVANTISSDDVRSRETFNKIKKDLEHVEEKSPANIPEVNERVIERLQQWEKLERLRRDIREKLSKEVNKLKGDVQDKLNEIESSRAAFEAQKIQYEAQLHLLQNTCEQNASLVEKLTQESSDKEAVISRLKIKASEMENQLDELQEDLRKRTEELEDNNKEINGLRKVNKEKDSQIRDIQSSLDNYERASQKNFQGDKEKSDLLDSLKSDIRASREELNSKVKQVDELDDALKAALRENQKSLAEKANLEKSIDELKAQVGALKLNILKLETNNSELEEKLKLGHSASPDEISNLERFLEDKDKAYAELEEQLNDAKRSYQLYSMIKDEKEELEANVRNLEIDYEDLVRKNKDLTAENEQLKYKSKQLDKLAKEAANYQQQLKKVQNTLSYLEQFGDKPAELQEAVNKMTAEIADRDNQMAELLKELEELKEIHEISVKKHELAMNRAFLIRLCNSFKYKQDQYFKSWRAMTKKAYKHKPTFEEPKVEDEVETANLSSADREIVAQNKQMIENNVIMQSLKTSGFANEKPLSYINLFKFLEDLMDKKFETDRKDLIDKRQPRSMTEFLMEHLIRAFGIQKLANKQLAQLVPALNQLYNEGHKYATFFCRLLQLFHPEPVPFNLAIFLVKARMNFHPLMEKLEKARSVQGKKMNTPSSGKTHGRAAYDTAGTGGTALLSDVIELLYSIFLGDKESGTLALELIKPDLVSDVDFVAYKICHKMAKLGKTPEAIFNMLDKDGGGSIDVIEFIEGTKQDLDLWISDEQIKKFMGTLDETGTGEVTKEKFLSRINMRNLMEWNRSDDWVVTKALYLITLIEVFKSKQRKDTAFLYTEFSKFGTDTISQDQFTQSLVKLDSLLTSERLNDLCEEARQESEEINQSGFTSVILKYGIGGFGLGAFMIRELLETLSTRIIQVDVQLGTGAISSSSTRTTRRTITVEENKGDSEEIVERIVTKKIIKKTMVKK